MYKYNDIIHCKKPQYEDLYPMSIHDRAAQFSPFAALVGYDDAVAETARLVDSKLELTEDEINELNANLNRLIENISDQNEIRVTYFVPDIKKNGGRYVNKTGTVRIFDSYTKELVFTDHERISVYDMLSVEFLEKQRISAS